MGDTDAAPATDDARACLERLNALGAASITPLQRASMLEALESRITAALSTLELAFAGLPQPLEPGPLEALNLSRTLAIAAADRNAEAARAAGPTAGREPLMRAAMGFLTRALRTSYKSYARVPAGTWKRVHQLQLEAERVGAAKSIEPMYRRALLVALTDPYRLEPGDVDRIEKLLDEIDARFPLAKDAPAAATGRHFVVRCEEDGPPVPMRRDFSPPPGAVIRTFETGSVVDALRARTRDAFATKLLSLWEDPPKRVMQREPAEGSVAICVGVKPIAHFVAHDATADGEAETRALREGITMPLRALPEDEGGHLIPIHEWAVINLSAGGVRVRRRAQTAYPIVVGEVVGIRAPGKAAWTIGVTRWISADEQGSTEFGVQYFAQAVCAVWIRSAAAPSAPRLGLLVTETDGDGSSESLLAPPDTYSSAGRFELRGEGLRSRVRRGTLVESNRRFELFRIEPE